MTIPKKSSRVIDVDGVVYRYLIRKGPYVCYPYLCLRITCQIDAALGAKGKRWRGQLLVTTVPVADEGESVTPYNVKYYIAEGMRQGWKPGEKGPPFVQTISRAFS